MLLYHGTNYEYIYSILKDGKLKPSSKTKNKEQNPYDFYSPYIFFSAIPNNTDLLNQLSSAGFVGLVFSSSILYKHKFYTNNSHSAGVNQKTKKYNKTLTMNSVNKVLNDLYKKSLNVFRNIKERNKKKTWIVAFQEVLTRVEPSLEHLEYILLCDPPNKLVQTIKKKVSTYKNNNWIA